MEEEKGFKKLIVWKMAYELRKKIYISFIFFTLFHPSTPFSPLTKESALG